MKILGKFVSQLSAVPTIFRRTVLHELVHHDNGLLAAHTPLIILLLKQIIITPNYRFERRRQNHTIIAITPLEFQSRLPTNPI